MILWIFSGVTLTAVLTATFVANIRRAVLALWIAGLGVGGIYLTLGAELLAVTQWIVSTLVAISFMFFSVMFGEFSGEDVAARTKKWVGLSLSVALGAAFAGVVWIGVKGLAPIEMGPPQAGSDLRALGKVLTEEQLLSLEVLAMTLFLVLVGGGVIARPERDSGGST